MVQEDTHRPRVAGVDQTPDLLVDHFADLLGIVLLIPEVTTEEDHLLLSAESYWTQPLAHAELFDHHARDRSRAFEIVLSSIADLTKHYRLGGVATEHRR